MKFTRKLKKAVGKTDSYLCVGLDPYLDRIPEGIKTQYARPEDQVRHFLKEIIEITADHCAAYKPNLAFFEALGGNGLTVFQEVINFIPDDKIIIADAKRGDISSTADHYARAYFEQFDADAITINPLMGFETLDSFIKDEEKGVFVLTLTSNAGASDFLMKPFANHNTMAEYIAQKLNEVNKKSAAHIGMVTGATQTNDLKAVISNHPEAALLIPGIGAQGGSANKFKAILQNHRGIPFFNSSRGILYAGEDNDDWRKAVEQQAKASQKQLNSIFKANV